MAGIKELDVNGRTIRFLNKNGMDYVCITDVAALKNPVEPKDVVKNWLRSRSTLSFLGLWEKLHNPAFKGVDFDPLLREAGENSFTMSPTFCMVARVYIEWIRISFAVGLGMN